MLALTSRIECNKPVPNYCTYASANDDQSFLRFSRNFKSGAAKTGPVNSMRSKTNWELPNSRLIKWAIAGLAAVLEPYFTANCFFQNEQKLTT